MNKAENTNIVHESEVQRQYARVKLPARLLVEQQGKQQAFALTDLSVGGFAFLTEQPFPVLNNCNGIIELNVDGFSFSIPINFDVKNRDKDGRVGCCFQGMSVSQTSSLRHIITSYLNGDLTSSGDMLNILRRDNYAKNRNQNIAGGLTGVKKVKALAGSVIFLCAGIAALLFIVNSLWLNVFVTQSETAVVRSVGSPVAMPREGIIRLLVKTGEQVKAGQIIGAFESPLISYLSGQQNIDNPGVLNAIAKQNYKGSIVSPCNCIVNELPVSDGQYLSKGAVIAHLNVASSVPFVEAKFPAKSIQSLSVGTTVSVNILGQSHKGKITSIKGVDSDGGMLDGALANIELTKPLSSSAVGSPARVSLTPFK